VSGGPLRGAGGAGGDRAIVSDQAPVVGAQQGPGRLGQGGQRLQLSFHEGVIEGWRPPDGLGGVGNDHVQVGLVPPQLPPQLLDRSEVAQGQALQLQTIRPGGSVRLGREAPGGVAGTKTTARSPVLQKFGTDVLSGRAPAQTLADRSRQQRRRHGLAAAPQTLIGKLPQTATQLVLGLAPAAEDAGRQLIRVSGIDANLRASG
jgi:hypothetical protein